MRAPSPRALPCRFHICRKNTICGSALQPIYECPCHLSRACDVCMRVVVWVVGVHDRRAKLGVQRHHGLRKIQPGVNMVILLVMRLTLK